MKTQKLILASMILLVSLSYGQGVDAIGSGGTGVGNPPIDDPDPCCLGNYCGMPVKSLFGHRQLDLGNYNFNFTSDRNYTNKVNIGFNCGLFSNGKLNILTNALTNSSNQWGSQECVATSALAENNTDWIYNIGTRTEAKTTARNTFPMGLYATASGPGNAYGVFSQITGTANADGEQIAGVFNVNKDNSWRNVGVYGSAIGANTNTTGSNRFNIGVCGFATDVTMPFAPFFNQLFYPQSNLAVYGGAGNYLSYSTPSNYYAGWFDGDVMVNGTGYNTSFAVFTSDRKFKDNIKTIESAMSIIEKLNPTTYFMKTKNEFGMNFSERKQFGFISQEVETILPELVTDVHKPASADKNGKEVSKAVDFKGLNYMGFIAILTKGLQEQQQQINEQKQLIDELSQKSAKTTGINSLNAVETGFQMSQNEPNPFTRETLVKYTLPTSVSNAFMAVYDLTGKQITTFPIEQKGSASITITSEKLAAGIYIYSIVADGKIVDSKRMIVAEK